MSEQNKAHVRRAIEEIYNKGDLAVVDELAASDMLIHTSSGEIRGRNGAKQYVAALRAGFPDIRFTVDDQIAEGDMVVTRWTARGTHTGVFEGIAPTGRRIRVAGTDIDHIVDGLTLECWAHLDELGLMRQLGVVEA
jgi:predicted ester cyclase